MKGVIAFPVILFSLKREQKLLGNISISLSEAQVLTVLCLL
jgi:hypothetical protein